MVFISIVQDGEYVILNCNKGSKDGEYFQLVIDKKTGELAVQPEKPDIDASAAYSHVFWMLKDGCKLPTETVAAWG